MIKTKNKSATSASAPATRTGSGSGSGSVGTGATAHSSSGITSSINGNFAEPYPMGGGHYNWSLSHSKNDDFIKFGVNLMVEGEQRHFESSMNFDELNQLFNWLYQAKATIQKKTAK